MQLENEKTESVNENKDKENENVDEFQEYILQQKPANTKAKTTKRHEGFECHIINPLLTRLVRSRWLDVGFVLFLRFHKKAKRELGQYPAILPSRVVNDKYPLNFVKLTPIQKDHSHFG